MKNSEKKTRLVIALVAAFMGAVVFIMIYGVQILNPLYTDWLIEKGDLSQHYFGWRFFRNADWQFPFGLLDTLGYPYYTSIVFTDSLPLFAVLFKLLSPVLPAEFQYFGLWGILCFMLQGTFGALLCMRYTKSFIQVSLGSLLFIFSPVILQRLYYHSALAGHWLILIALILLVYQKKLAARFKTALLLWGLLGALIASIHQYFLVMCGIICLGYCAYELFGVKRWYGFLPCITFILGAVGVDYLLGAFSSSASTSAGGIGNYSFNLNGFLNPQGYSRILSNLPTYNDQHEGFAYLGLGVILLCVFVVVALALYYFITKGEESYPQLRDDLRAYKMDIIIYGMILVLSVALSVSPMITWRDKVIFTLKFPKKVIEIWSIFRATGRLVWPAIYIIVIAAISLVMKKMGKQLAIVVLAICVCVQCYDLSAKAEELNHNYADRITYDNPLMESVWTDLGTEGEVKHLILSSSVVGSKYLYPLADIAAQNNWTLNDFYFARSIEGVTLTWDKEISDPGKDMIFVMTAEEFEKKGMALSQTVAFYKLDGLVIGLPAGKRVSLPEAEYKYSYSFENEENLHDGKDLNGVRYIYHEGVSFGPYIDLAPGIYEVSIQGTNLDQAQIYATCDAGKSDLKLLDYQESSTTVGYRIQVTEMMKDMETLIRNHSDQTVTLTGVVIKVIK